MRRKRACIGFSGLLSLLAIASTAFACTAFLGSFTVTGNAGGSVTVNGTDTPNTFTMTQTVNNGIAKATKTGGSFSISTGTATNGSKLPKNTYGIRYYNSSSLLPGYMGTGTSRQWVTDCMSAPFGTKIGDTQVNSAGQVTGQTSFSFNNTLPLNTNPAGVRESAVCITDSSALYGNQAPITIV